ncbi:HD-GYP domain-containing protein [Deinococcus radiotolerans]|uniref:HD-GYP domain-containing protein n=1 Tax=Deinococcus radiotolerans TaxID=1309407 RepID=A0ABQ2FRH4_9DEIO|nr:HD domain-containing phosphohydrolase [Deinococcus radiotolerans]GGL19613.1 hypothetical protein GCM10010844_43220 [Deinococcus radiotolerans]
MSSPARLADLAAPAPWRQLRRLARRAEAPSTHAEQHMDRVGHLSALIAQAYGLSAQDAQHLGQAATVHDIGKVVIPASILKKPGPLTLEEFEVIKTHCRAGANLLWGHTPLQRLAAEIALSHHERWDGQGYPYGWAGTQTPVSARIVAVADVFDALTRDRPYKRAWSRAQALREIATQAGQHFDPAVVAAFKTVLGLTLH